MCLSVSAVTGEVYVSSFCSCCVVVVVPGVCAMSAVALSAMQTEIRTRRICDMRIPPQTRLMYEMSYGLFRRSVRPDGLYPTEKDRRRRETPRTVLGPARAD